MPKDYVQQFNDLSNALLSKPERDEFHRSLRQYQRSRDTASLVATVERLLNTPEKARLIAYVRAPMSRVERTRFDRMLSGSPAASDTHSSPGTSASSQRPDYLGRITMPPNSATTSERLVTISGTRGGSMGFSVRGGSEFGLGIYVSHVSPGSPANHAGLQVGDQVITANGVDLQCVANSGAVKVLSSSALLNLVIKRLHKVPEWKVARERVLWYEVSQRRVVSTPPVSEAHTNSPQPSILVERRLVLTLRSDSDYIGLNIRGGKEYGIGIYISRVDPGGLASSNGLRPGDQIVRVNTADFQAISHSDAVDVLRSSTNLIITIRSVGKYPVFKELYAEYTWTDTGAERNLTVNGSYLADKSLTGTRPTGPKKHTQRTRARESSVDLVPFSAANINSLSNSNRVDSIEDLDQVEELDDGFPVNGKVYQPNDKDIMFRRSYEDSWRDIDALSDNYARPEDLTTSWSVDNTDSLGHYSQDADMDAPAVDYTTFLQRSAQRDRQSHQTRLAQEAAAKQRASAAEPVVIETVIEEAVTPFTSSVPMRSPSINSGRSGSVMTPEEEEEVDGLYARVFKPAVMRTNGADSVRGVNGSRPGSTSTASSISGSGNSGSGQVTEIPSPVLSNGSTRSGSRSSRARDDDEDGGLELLTSQIQTLEARKSHLGTYEINRVAASPKSPSSPDSTQKNKTGTWSSLKKKLKGSLRFKGSSEKSRARIPSDFGPKTPEENTTSTLGQKGVFERSFGSQILNTPHTERYNLMGMLEDHARMVLSEDECKAVMRHVHTYQDAKSLDRLVEMLLEILDKPDKRMLLVDVRNVIYPSHLTKYDEMVSHVNLRDNEEWVKRFNPGTNLSAPEDDPSSPEPEVEPEHVYNEPEVEEAYTSFSSQDFRNTPATLEVIIQEEEDSTNHKMPESPVGKGEEIVYVSKHKKFLGLELGGGRDDPEDQAIRIKRVIPGGAASDDSRLQPGVEIARVDKYNFEGMSCKEAESALQIAFSVKSPVNMGIRIRHSRL